MSGAIDLKITNSNKHFTQTPKIQEVNPDVKRNFKVAKAAKEFESLLTSMMLKSMSKTTNGLMGDGGFGGDMFNSIFEDKIASFMTEQNSYGIAEHLYRKLTGEELDMQKLKEEMGYNPVRRIKTEPAKENTNVASVLSPSKASMNRLQKYDDIIKKASESFGIDTNIIKSVILTESAAKHDAVSSAKAKGLMQLMDGTAKDMGVRNVWNPAENIFGGTKYLSKMFRQYEGDMDLALAAYNAGPGNVEKHGGIPPFEETKNYINRVKGYLKYLGE